MEKRNKANIPELNSSVGEVVLETVMQVRRLGWITECFKF